MNMKNMYLVTSFGNMENDRCEYEEYVSCNFLSVIGRMGRSLARDTLNKGTAETWAKRSTNSWANSWAAPNVAPGANRQQRKPRDGPKSHPIAEEGDMANVSRRSGKWVGVK